MEMLGEICCVEKYLVEKEMNRIITLDAKTACFDADFCCNCEFYQCLPQTFSGGMMVYGGV